MNLSLCLVLASLAFGLPTIPKARRSKRAIGGEPAAPNQFPFIVSLILDGYGHNCGGSIINENWIVTAAHCVNDYWPYEYTVLAGTNLLDTGGTSYKVDQIIVHPKYSDFSSLINDIALVKIEGAFAFDDSVRPIDVGIVSPGNPVTVIGWGATEYLDGDTDMPNALQFANVVSLSNRDCVKKAKNGVFEFEKNRGRVCTLAEGRVAPCFGDSGGPLVFNGTLVGIVSYAISPCANGFPDVYTRAHHYIHWINHIVKNN